LDFDDSGTSEHSNILSENILADALCPQTLWIAKRLTRSIVTRAHAP
jgi:hypothetical protein